MSRALLASTAAAILCAAQASAGGLQPPIPHLGSPPAPSSFAGVCPVIDPVIQALQGQGFTSFVVEPGPSQARIMAMRGDLMNEFVYDCDTAQLLSQRSGRSAPGHSPGIVVSDGEGDEVPSVDGGTIDSSEGHAGDTNRDGLIDVRDDADGDGDIDSDDRSPGSGGAGRGPGSNPGDANGDGRVDQDDDFDGDGDVDDEDRAAGGRTGAGNDGGRDNGNRGGCGDVADDENRPDRQDNCGHGNNADGVDEDNPGLLQGGGPDAGAGGDRGNGPGQGGLGGDGS